MARLVKPLTATQVQNAKPKDKPYKLFDGGGLFLHVTPSGGKHWKMKFRQANGKESLLSFGAFPEVTLEQARRKRDEARTQKAAGKDPGEVRRQEKAERESMSKNSFGALAAKWMELAESKVSPKTMRQYRGVMDRNLLPSLGHMHIRDIRSADILAPMKELEKQDKTATSR